MARSADILARGRRRWVLHGQVQGVGFRPFVYRLAQQNDLVGFVFNVHQGVCIEAQGEPAALDRFAAALRQQAPSLARISRVTETAIAVRPDDRDFRILQSHDREDGDGTAACGADVAVDSAVCEDCLGELFSSSDRRRGYGLINCTNCGPRFTILRRLPYDRCNTTVSHFQTCSRCSAEYQDPSDRRFHAQPIACHDCGPQLQFVSPLGQPSPQDPIRAAAAALAHGRIVAIKGIGGFHLAVRADDELAVGRLRVLKERDAKPFALTCRSLPHARRLVQLGEAGAAAITSPARPIVLAPRQRMTRLARSVAGDLPRLGVMLPYAPVHHLLFASLDSDIPALVMTSGNPSSEPLVTANDEAVERLSTLCDAMLWHDRPIVRAVDDSVLLDLGDEEHPLPVRRARGFVPTPIPLHIAGATPGISLGGELKSTVSLARGQDVIVSQHLGDLTHPRTFRAFCIAVNDLTSLFDLRPAWIAHDLHPMYLSTAQAQRLATRWRAPLVPVQHHHAHAAAVMVEHGHPGPVLAVTCDGTGYGTDGTTWGGELLLADLVDFRRLARLRPLRLPGGDAAAIDPRRSAMAMLFEALGSGFEHHRAALALIPAQDERLLIARMIRQNVGCALSSGAGRSFDAVAALLGICTKNAFEAQAAMLLEAAAEKVEQVDLVDEPPLFELCRGQPVEIDLAPLIRALLTRSVQGEPVERLAALFHEQFARAWDQLVADAVEHTGVASVVLSGGVFCNARLTRRLESLLRQRGLHVMRHRIVPPNDGGLSLGQAAVAAARAARGLLREAGA